MITTCANPSAGQENVGQPGLEGQCCEALESNGAAPAGQNASRSTAFLAGEATRSEGATLLKPSQSEDGQVGSLPRTSDQEPAMSSTKDERDTIIAATPLTHGPASDPTCARRSWSEIA